jgi:magnesium transporter
VPESAPLRQREVVEGMWWWKRTIVVADIPAGLEQSMVENHDTQVALPEDTRIEVAPDPERPGYLLYRFPEKCKVHHPPVSRYRLSLVISLAVAAICLWGTLVGSMLPLVFKRLGFDPGVASSPFVATFVDVTGIIIYFSIAKAVLGDILT